MQIISLKVLSGNEALNLLELSLLLYTKIYSTYFIL